VSETNSTLCSGSAEGVSLSTGEEGSWSYWGEGRVFESLGSAVTSDVPVWIDGPPNEQRAYRKNKNREGELVMLHLKVRFR